ncbi:SGNH/GDSL hydrolase family protein [soil metagenome]
MKRFLLSILLLIAVVSVSRAEDSLKPSPPSSQPTAAASAALPVEIKPDDAKLYYVGRFDHRDPAGPRAAWPNSSVTIRFNGTDLQAKIAGKNYLAVSVDGEFTNVIVAAKDPILFDVARGLPAGEHTVSIIRRNETSAGPTQFLGFYLNEGATLAEPKKLARKIEFIGDSITCGYGDEGQNEKEHFKGNTANAAMTYAAVAARELGAEGVVIAWSGRKMAPNNTVPEVYDRALGGDKTSTWDFKSWTPDVVLINLSTNDFNAKQQPAEAEWVAAYAAFIERLRKNYPDAMVYVTTSPMLNGEKKKTTKAYLEKVIETSAAAGDKKVALLEFPTQNMKADGLGSDWHPSLKTHQKMASILVARLKEDLKW